MCLSPKGPKQGDLSLFQVNIKDHLPLSFRGGGEGINTYTFLDP